MNPFGFLKSPSYLSFDFVHGVFVTQKGLDSQVIGLFFYGFWVLC
jgi:hypothetical protein